MVVYNVGESVTKYGLSCFVVTRASGATTAAARRTGEITIATDSDSSDTEDSDIDSDSSVEGYSYYGGYGRCYRCGKFLKLY